MNSVYVIRRQLRFSEKSFHAGVRCLFQRIIVVVAIITEGTSMVMQSCFRARFIRNARKTDRLSLKKQKFNAVFFFYSDHCLVAVFISRATFTFWSYFWFLNHHDNIITTILIIIGVIQQLFYNCPMLTTMHNARIVCYCICCAIDYTVLMLTNKVERCH